MLRTITYTVFAFLFTLVLVLPARSHKALPTAAQPYGWQYSWKCCSGTDCAMVQKRNIIEGPNEITIRLAKGEHPMVTLRDVEYKIPYSSDKIQESPDGEYHVCKSRQFVKPDGSIEDGTLYCVYLTPKGY